MAKRKPASPRPVAGPTSAAVPSPIEAALKPVETLAVNGKTATTHPAKLIVLGQFLKDAFGVATEDLLPGIEKKVGSKILGLRGAVDLLYAGTVIELKTDYDSERDDALSGLKKYFQSLLEAHPNRRYVGLATDLIKFETFRPIVKGGRVDNLETISTFDLSARPHGEALLWLDALLVGVRSQVPTADELAAKFGPAGPTFAVAVDEIQALWAKVRSNPRNQLKLRIWTRIMEIVYGSAPNEEAFVAQTYLSLVVKLLVYLKIEETPLTSGKQARDVVDGTFFQEHGLTNLIEEDFFAWILNDDVARPVEQLVLGLARALQFYDMNQADEDLFKELYQRIVGIHRRHGTGEYYTPRWLCEYALQQALDTRPDKETPRILDPACGSGSFLTAAVHEFRERLKRKSPEEQLEAILNHVEGLDVNPVAVTIARANYAIALGDLVQIGQTITLPVYVADSLKLPVLQPTFYGKMRAYALTVDGNTLVLPETIFSDPERRIKILNLFRDTLAQYDGPKTKKDALAYFQREAKDLATGEESPVLEATLATLFGMVDKNANSIWLFVLNNLYAPLAMKERPFSLVIGNPPWLVQKSIENKDYQNFLKAETIRYGLLQADQTKLFPSVEMATLFFCKAAELYLEKKGTLAFVMPTSVTTGAEHHQRFNQFANPPMQLLRVDDYRGVPGIFSLPPIVLTALKDGTTTYPVDKTTWKGSLLHVRRNAPWQVVQKVLTSQDGQYTPAQAPKGHSPYYDEFHEGATIVPHLFWYVEPVPSRRLGVNAKKPLFRSSLEEDRVAKRPWKGKYIKGPVEANFVFASYLGKDLIPFGTLTPRPVVVPLVTRKGKRELLDVDVLKADGNPLMAAWLKTAQTYWESHANTKSKERFPRILDRLDYHRTLTNPDPSKRWVVVYNARGADAMCCVLDRKRLPSWKIGGATLKPVDFVGECTNMFYETENEDEAHFLAAVLNTPTINEAVKPFQPRGAYGARDIYRRPLQLNVPKFDSKNKDHQQLVDLSRQAHKLIAALPIGDDGFRTLRNRANAELQKAGVPDRLNAIIAKNNMSEPSEELLTLEPQEPLPAEEDEAPDE